MNKHDLPEEGSFIIVFDDASVEEEMFTGYGARDAALRRYDQISISWNAHLYVKIDSNSRDCTIPNADVEQKGWETMTDEARKIQMRHLDDHTGDVYHAMQYLSSRFGKKDRRPMTQPI